METESETENDRPSISVDTEALFKSECFNCSQNDKHVEAEVYCVECKDNFCKSCLNDHNKIARLRTHEIKDKSAVKPGTTQGELHPPTEKCLEHHGRLIDTYCVSHDAVCCSVCVSVDHKFCPDVKCIPTVASGVSNSTEFSDTQATTKLVLLQLDSVKKRRLENLANVRTQRIEVLERASEATQQLIESIEELGEKTATELTDKYNKLEDGINNDLKELTKLIDSLEEALNQMQNSLNNETKLFVQMKQHKKTVSEGKKQTESLWSNIGQEYCTYEMNDSIEKYLESIKSLVLVRFGQNFEYGANPQSKEVIRCSYEFLPPNITGICSIDDGGLIVADNANSCLKKLDSSFRIQCRCVLLSQPVDICQIGPAEVAVAMLDGKTIQFVSVGPTMTFTRSFTTRGECECTGIACKDGKLYVSRNQSGSSSRVQVYDMRGSLLQTIEKDKCGSPIFNQPRLIAISTRSSNIYVADAVNGIIILDKSGKLVAKISDPTLIGPHGVCVLPGHQLLVCGWRSHNVIQFDSHGRKVKTLLTRADGVKNPRALHLDPVTFRLIVEMKDSKKIKVFNLVRTLET